MDSDAAAVLARWGDDGEASGNDGNDAGRDGTGVRSTSSPALIDLTGDSDEKSEALSEEMQHTQNTVTVSEQPAEFEDASVPPNRMTVEELDRLVAAQLYQDELEAYWARVTGQNVSSGGSGASLQHGDITSVALLNGAPIRVPALPQSRQAGSGPTLLGSKRDGQAGFKSSFRVRDSDNNSSSSSNSGGGGGSGSRAGSVASQLADVRRQQRERYESARGGQARTGVRQGHGGLQASERMQQARRQMSDARQTHRAHWEQARRQQKKRVFTTADLAKMVEQDRDRDAGVPAPSSFDPYRAQMGRAGGVHTIRSTFYDPQRLGMEMLALTNEFREREGLPPLKWSQALCDIAKVHSQNMADGAVPMGHHGFQDRVRQYPFPTRGAAENVAWSKGHGDVARTAVDGWIKSPGHRKNLVSTQVYCGIGVVEAKDGGWYSTQLFGLP